MARPVPDGNVRMARCRRRWWCYWCRGCGRETSSDSVTMVCEGMGKKLSDGRFALCRRLVIRDSSLELCVAYACIYGLYRPSTQHLDLQPIISQLRHISYLIFILISMSCNTSHDSGPTFSATDLWPCLVGHCVIQYICSLLPITRTHPRCCTCFSSMSSIIGCMNQILLPTELHS